MDSGLAAIQVGFRRLGKDLMPISRKREIGGAPE